MLTYNESIIIKGCIVGMKMKWYTLLVLVVVTIFLSSFFTLFIADNNGLLNYFEQSTLSYDAIEEVVPEDVDVFEKFVDAYNLIQNLYIYDTDSQDLIDGAIQGMLESLDDKHSVYMNADVAEDFYTTLDGSFQGIGAEVTMENGRVTVIAPIKGSPAEKAGIQTRDQIIEVNGESLEGLSLYEAVQMIRGPKGTEANLTVVRPGISSPVVITVIRDDIPNITVYAETISTKEGMVGKIEITDFAEKTADEFKKALKDLEKENIEGLIIDLRGNPGGYLQSVLDIGDQLIANRGIIVQIEDKDGEVTPYKSSMGEAKYPVVALIDEGSASASEILAAALQEACGYKLIGETSYGKGTVQNVYDLDDGSNVKLTIAKWLTSDGNWINGNGVKPDIEISQPEYYYSMFFADDTNIQRDMNNVQVKNLQIILNGLGFDSEREDGYFDEKTESAVKAFQKAHGLEDSGIVDSKTIEVLEIEISKKVKDPSSDSQLQVAIETIKKLIK